jgi:CheY-like chemotaxis protein
MSNLLTNAAKYTQRRGRVEVRGRRTGSTITIEIQDNGIGIEPTLINGIFEPFAQASQAIDRSRGGLGLGLAIVSSLVKLHDGRVRASSDGPGRGSIFTVELPVDEGQKAHETSTAAAQASNERHARILVVDDNVDAALLLVDLLEARGYAAVAAHDGPGALRVMETFHPEIAVLDIGLPVMDGFELARAIRTDERFAKTKLVALTGYGQAQDRERTKDAGFVAHFVKPVDNFALHKQLQVLLGD